MAMVAAARRLPRNFHSLAAGGMECMDGVTSQHQNDLLNLWRSRLDGSQLMQLTYPPLLAYQPWWSPDGKRIAFMGISTDRHWHI